MVRKTKEEILREIDREIERINSLRNGEKKESYDSYALSVLEKSFEEKKKIYKEEEREKVKKSNVVRINGMEIEVPEGYEVVVEESGKIKLVPKEDEDWEKIRKEFDKIDPKDMIPVGSGVSTELYGNPKLAESVLREFGIKRTPRELAEYSRKQAILGAWGITFLFLFFFLGLPLFDWLGNWLERNVNHNVLKAFGIILFLILIGVILLLPKVIKSHIDWLYGD